MVIRLVSIQIPKFWDVIKFALQQVERIGVDDREDKFNHLFASLLNDKSQCFLKYDSEGRIIAVVITEITEDYVTKFRRLRIRCLYSFSILNAGQWSEGVTLLKNFAEKEKCREVFFETSHPKVEEIMTSMGFSKSYITMTHSIGD